MSTRILFVALLMLSVAVASAAPPVSNSSGGWLALPSPTAWLPSFSTSSKSKTQEPPLLTRATVGAWKSVSSSIGRSWRWTATTLNPWSDKPQSKPKSASPGFWQQLFAPQPEREVDTVTDFLAQPKPY